MQFNVKIILLALETVLTAGAAVTIILCRKKRPVVTGLKVFFLEEMYPAGSFLREKWHKSDKKARERTRKLMEFYGPAEAARISANAAAAPYCYAMVLAPLAVAVLALTGSAAIFLLELVLIVFLCVYFDLWLEGERKRRNEEIRKEYPSMLTELSLMIHVGIPASSAFERVAMSSEGVLYREMRSVVSNMKNGMPAEDAFDSFILRCPHREIRKFVSLYRQNLVKGGADFPKALNEMAADAWDRRKTAAVTKGELAEQKLLLPTIFMFVGILLMVVVPAFQSIL